jgi:hypothetical protein
MKNSTRKSRKVSKIAQRSSKIKIGKMINKKSKKLRIMKI